MSEIGLGLAPYEAGFIGVVTIGTLLILFVFVPWLLFHYITKWRAQSALSADEERMLEDLWKSAKRMEARVIALETIMDAESPGWRSRDV